MRNIDDRDLEAFFADVHRRLDPAAPEFDELWAAAAAETKERARRKLKRGAHRGRGLATLVAAAVVLVAVLPFALQFSRRQRTFDEEEALRFAHSLSAWRSSTQVLERTPGLELLESTPSLSFRPAWRAAVAHESPGTP